MVAEAKRPERKRGRKRGNGEGSVYQRADGLWVGSLMVGRRVDGKPDRRAVYGKTRAEVQTKLDDLRNHARTGVLVEPHRLTVETFVAQWLRDSVALNSRPSTYATYTSVLHRHVLPRIGAIKLTAVRPAHIQSVYAAMTAAKLSPATIQTTHAALHRAFDQAVDWGYMGRNPTNAADPPTVRRRDMQTLTAAEARQLVEVADGAADPWGTLWRLLIDTGARIGEALALTWQDIDLDRGVIAIQRTLRGRTLSGEPVFGEPKTHRSVRTITLMPATVTALRAHRVDQNEQRLALGPSYLNHGLVFPGESGTATGHERVINAFRRALRRAELPVSMRLHDLRHSCATLMLAAGVNPRVAADRLGHANVSITLSVYSHVTPSMEADAAVRLARVLDGTG